LLMAGRLMLAVASLSLLAAVLLGVRLFSSDEGEALLVRAGYLTGGEPIGLASSSVSPPDEAPRIGIVAGHAGFDPGATCPDGLAEASVNKTIAQEVYELLSDRGYQVDLLEEYDDRLTGYQADALVSVHADSCDVPDATGFKVARITNSAIPEAEDRLVACIYQQYELATGASRHPGSITDNMTNYHAFREIDSFTPGAIIETGFLLRDRDLLINRHRLVARGIASGVVCFVEGLE
jgi:N-acetylmuramoyl-L-alanine amidase